MGESANNGKVIPFKKEPRLSQAEQLAQWVNEEKPDEVVMLCLKDGQLSGYSTPGIEGYELIGVLATALHAATDSADVRGA
jgi:hypothetical protein